jgi:hypothetical protein
MSTAHSQNYEYQASQRLFIGGLAAPSCETTFSGSQQSDWHLAIVGATSSPSLLLATFAFTSLLASAFVLHPGSWQGLKESTAIERWWKMDRDAQVPWPSQLDSGHTCPQLEHQHLGPQHHSFSHGSHPPCRWVPMPISNWLDLNISDQFWWSLYIFIWFYMPYANLCCEICQTLSVRLRGLVLVNRAIARQDSAHSFQVVVLSTRRTTQNDLDRILWEDKPNIPTSQQFDK